MSSPLTWKNMYDSGLLDKSILTTQTGAVKDTNKTNGVKSGRQKAKGGTKNLSYPVNRSAAESEDTFLIKAIEYIPPKDKIGKGNRGGDVNKAVTGAANDPSNTSGGVYAYGQKNKDGKWEIFFRNAGGMDRRIRSGYSSDPAGFQEKIKYYIELPIPQQISDSTSVTWGEDSMNIMQAAAAGLASGIVEDGPIEFAKNLSDIAQNLELPNVSDDTVRAIKKSLAGEALNQAGVSVSAQSLLGRATGQILNSNLELLFQGVSLRSFPFNITFSPRSQPESQRVKDIIRALKQSMVAKRGAKAFGMNGGIFLNPPDVFLLRYLSNGKDHPFLNVFKPCALTNMSVNYTGAGTYATYGDATPVNIKVSLMFKEINPVYAEDYTESQGRSGVGF